MQGESTAGVGGSQEVEEWTDPVWVHNEKILSKKQMGAVIHSDIHIVFKWYVKKKCTFILIYIALHMHLWEVLYGVGRFIHN